MTNLQLRNSHREVRLQLQSIKKLGLGSWPGFISLGSPRHTRVLESSIKWAAWVLLDLVGGSLVISDYLDFIGQLSVSTSSRMRSYIYKLNTLWLLPLRKGFPCQRVRERYTHLCGHICNMGFILSWWTHTTRQNQQSDNDRWAINVLIFMVNQCGSERHIKAFYLLRFQMTFKTSFPCVCQPLVLRILSFFLPTSKNLSTANSLSSPLASEYSHIPLADLSSDRSEFRNLERINDRSKGHFM